jgi:anti-sigma factor RsiW
MNATPPPRSTPWAAHPGVADLVRYVEALLPDEEESAIAAHLESCPACESAVAEIERGRRRLPACELSTPLAEPPATTLRRSAGREALHQVQVGDEIGDCRLLQELGRGAFARVFLAE